MICGAPNGLFALDLTSMDDALSKPVIEKRLNMTIGLLGNSEGITFQSAHGFTTLAKDTPAEVDSVVAIASMTKLITTVAALQLYEEGKLDIDESVDVYVESLSGLKILTGFNDDNEPILIAPKRRPTVRELMSHTSGFVYSMWNRNAMIAEEAGLTGDLMSGKDMIVNAPLAFEPGEQWEYGIGTDWLGVIVENVSGMTLAEYFEENIFTPLQMEDSFMKFQKTRLSVLQLHFLEMMAIFLLQVLSLFSESDLIEIPLMSSPSPSAQYSRVTYSGGGSLYSTPPRLFQITTMSS